jgi:hypothetical protein
MLPTVNNWARVAVIVHGSQANFSPIYEPAKPKRIAQII